MPDSFRPYVDVVLPHLPQVLADSAARSAVRTLADGLAPLAWGGFEFQLGEHTAQVDLHQGIDIRKGDVPVLLDHIASMETLTSGAIPPEWARIRSLCEELSDPTTRLGANITRMGLEFDIGTSGSQRQAPSLFVQMKPDLPALERLATVRSLLSVVGHGTPEPGFSAILERCFTSCAGGSGNPLHWRDVGP